MLFNILEKPGVIGMKKKTILILLLSIFITIPDYAAYSQNIVNKKPNISSQFVLLMDGDSGRVLFDKNSNKVVPMASTTKIITAIVALENSNLNDIVTISKRASSIRGSTIGLKDGQKLTVEQLIYGLMLKSGNDCAIAIAEHVSGSVEKFVVMMNSKAFDIGAFNTHFVTPHGLDEDGHFTTVYDLALITRYAFNNEMFSKIVSTKNITINGASGPRSFSNINKTLWNLKGADGVQTGYTGKAGKCLVASANRDGKRIICVLLNSNNRWDDSKSLIEYGFNNFKSQKLISKADYNNKIIVENGQKLNVMAGIDKDITISVSDKELDNFEVKVEILDNLKAPVLCGEQIGTLSIYADNKVIFSVPYRAIEDVPKLKTKNMYEKFINKFSIQ